MRFFTSGNVRRVGHFFAANGCSEVKKNRAHAIGATSSILCRVYSSYGRRHVPFTSPNAKENLHNTCVRSFSVLTRHNTIHHAQIASKRFYQTRSRCGAASSPLNSAQANTFFSVLFRCNTMAHHARIAWKRYYQIHSCSGATFSPLNKSVRMPVFFYAPLRSNTMTRHARIAWKRLSQIRNYTGPSFLPLNNRIRAVILALRRSHPVVNGILASIIGAVLWPRRTSASAEEYLPSGNTLYMHAQDGHAYLTSLILSVLEGFVLFTRAIYLAFLFSPIIAMAPFADSFGLDFRERWLRLIRTTLETAGPAFIKWGQWAATRPDLFPRDLCIELSRLHTQAPEHSFAYTKKTIEKAFGRKLREIFDDFEEAPVASGSVAQVHRATLRFRYPGKQDKPIVVAVKVRHPGVSESIRKDFVIIHFFAKMSSLIPALKWLRLDESVQQFAVFMMSQVDLSREAAQLSRFLYNFRKSKYVSFPRPLYPLVHPAVLVETYEKGESVSRYIDDNDELEGNDRVKRALADIGTNALLKMLLEDNFVHADMHPGNILVRVAQEDPNWWWPFKSKPHVIFLDVGMTAELSRSDQLNLREFFKAVAVRDGRTAAECTLRFSKNQNCPNPNAFIEEVEESFAFWGTEEGDIVHPAECMHELLEKVRRHKVNIDGNVCTVMVTTLVLEGWQRKLDPDYNVMHTLQTLLFTADWVEDLVYTVEALV